MLSSVCSLSYCSMFIYFYARAPSSLHTHTHYVASDDPGFARPGFLDTFLYCSGVRVIVRFARSWSSLFLILVFLSLFIPISVLFLIPVYQIQSLFQFFLYHGWMLICDFAVIVDLLWFRFITCSGYIRFSVYTWGIFLAYMRCRLSSRLHFHIFWEAGRDKTRGRIPVSKADLNKDCLPASKF